MMNFGPNVFRKITIVGVGLIGGSIGLAIRKNKLAREIAGMSQHQSTLDAAKKVKAIDQGYTDLRAAVQNADCVIFATPVSTIISLLAVIGPHLKRGCVVTDVGSTKSAIQTAAEKHLPQHVFFIGGHPLAGSEQKGVEHARADLFEKSTCILTSTDNTNRRARDRVKSMWNKMGAVVKIMETVQHDQTLAYVSHLPHLAAFAMMDAIPGNFLEFGAQGLKDTTRIASSSPQMWNDICLANSKNVTVAIDDLVKRLALVRRSIVRRDQKQLLEFFKSAKTKRDGMA